MCITGVLHYMCVLSCTCAYLQMFICLFINESYLFLFATRVCLTSSLHLYSTVDISFCCITQLFSKHVTLPIRTNFFKHMIRELTQSPQALCSGVCEWRQAGAARASGDREAHARAAALPNPT